jgi:hypothetical protein
VPSVAAGFAASAQGRRLGWLLHAHVVETRFRQLADACKYNFDPNQPRVPAGGGRGGDRLSQVAQHDPLVRLTGIPSEKPTPSRLRNIAIRIVARQVSLVLQVHEELRSSVGQVLNLLEAASWLHEFVPDITAYADPPKTLEELQQAVSIPALGYQIHHIVEQGPAAKEGFPCSKIDAHDNLVRIPTLKHHEITGWFGKPNKDYQGLSPRDYLRGKDWAERTIVGRDALIEHEVLKP